MASPVLAQDKIVYPVTPKRPVTDTFFGVKVTEDYRWLENGKDPEVKAWVDKENELTRSTLDAYPQRAQVAAHLMALYSTESPTYGSLEKRPGLLFAMKDQPPKQQQFLVTLKSPDDTSGERVVVDPNALDSTGGTAIDFYVPSHDGRLVAVSLSQGGSENGTVHIFEVATGKELGDAIPRVAYPTGGGSVAWNADNSGIWYTRYPAEGERPPQDMHFFQQVYFHKLGTPLTSDQYAIGKEFPRIAEVVLQTTDDGKHVLATVANGDGGQYAHYICGPSGKWSQITQFSDRISEARFGLNQSLFLLSRLDAPNGKILEMPLTVTELSKTRTIIPQSDVAIQDFVPSANRLYVVDMVGGPTRIRVFDLAGKEQVPIATEPISAVRSVTWMEGDEILYNQQSYLHPAAWFKYDPSMPAPSKTAMFLKTKVNFDDAEVTREMVTSKDGTKVPINILHLKGIKLDGQNPTILYGYGGYNISMTPSFSTFRRVWLDQGGVYAIANIRGGGEFGDEWHQEGNLTKKQNVFDDFAACAKYLIDVGYTNPAKLAIEGGSNGGLLMGAALTQHPEYYRAVVSFVGIYDMLRVELSPNGEFNTTEFGSVKNKAQFEALYAYSPYHHVTDGTAYPAVFFLSGENDGRVDPANSRKMTARLQEASSSGRPILLRQSSTSGHGIGTSFSEQIEQDADVFAFLFSQLGIQYKEPAASK
ncbi:MAG TPA: prolyl oligopeptidase family serine peptidase [Candidatus Acidoferrum sp.]|nr:prolyl oligopeptidase family serine peptidase [Candidatus Acidoferrum sp.]